MSVAAIALCTASGTCGIRRGAHLASWAMYMAGTTGRSPVHWPRSAPHGRRLRRPGNCEGGPR